MNDLTQYFELQNKVEHLETEKKLLRKELTRALNSKTIYMAKWKKLYEQHNPPIVTRSDKAMILIVQKHNGEIDLKLKQIAKQCFITYSCCKQLSSKHLRSLK